VECVYTQLLQTFNTTRFSRATTNESCGVVAKKSLHTHVELGLGSTVRLGLVRRFGH